jgi:hypothetical protein
MVLVHLFPMSRPRLVEFARVDEAAELEDLTAREIAPGLVAYQDAAGGGLVSLGPRDPELERYPPRSEPMTEPGCGQNETTHDVPASPGRCPS